jgi:hypothetical protein
VVWAGATVTDDVVPFVTDDHPNGITPEGGIGLAQGDEEYQLIFPDIVDGRLI